MLCQTCLEVEKLIKPGLLCRRIKPSACIFNIESHSVVDAAPPRPGAFLLFDSVCCTWTLYSELSVKYLTGILCHFGFVCVM